MPAQPLKPGSVVDTLRVDRVLGHGALAVTYLVTDPVLNKSFALKEYLPRDQVLRTADGRLAGSAIALIDAVRIATQSVGITLEESLRMASLYPAEYFGLRDRGRVRPGCRADLVRFTEDFEVTDTWLAGKHRSHT